MNIPFNDTTNLNGLVQFYEEEIGANQGDISGNTTLLKKFTARCNLAREKYFRLAVHASGKWQLDDSNQTDYAILTTSIVSGQRDYAINNDSSGNLIQDVYRVFVLQSATGDTYTEIFPKDAQSESGTEGYTDGQNRSGVPYTYDKTANAIFLDPVPDYNVALGLKIYANRAGTEYTYTDTTKTPGYPYHQEYFFLKPALDDARINNKSTLPRLEKAVFDLEGDESRGIIGLIAKAYSRRSKDERNVLSGKKELYI